MIRVTRMNGKSFIVNADLIEIIDETPDTVITLTTRNRIMVKESADDVVERALHFFRARRALPQTDAL